MSLLEENIRGFEEHSWVNLLGSQDVSLTTRLRSLRNHQILPSPKLSLFQPMIGQLTPKVKVFQDSVATKYQIQKFSLKSTS